MYPNYEELEERYPLRSSSTVKYVRYSHMVCFKAEGCYSRVFLKNGDSVLTSVRLGDHEKLLHSHPHFMRCHRSYLVNVRYITAVDKDCTVHLQHGNPIQVSVKLREKLDRQIPQRKPEEK